MIAERLAKLDRLQKSRGFKIAATIALALVAVGAFVAVWLNRTSFDADSYKVMEVSPDAKVGEGLSQEQLDALKSDVAKINRYYASFLENQGDLTSTGVGIAAAAGVLIGAVWLGMGLSILALLAAGAAVVLPLSYWHSTRDWARLAGGLLALALAFTVVMRLLNIALSLPGAVFAVARNVLAEATRQKISLVFIGMLVFALAATPLLLDAQSPLRYRVQSFLQYATGGTFWIVAVLVVLFSVSTVAGEQRDKVIWQTMTKPVAAWQYILGKWLGVAALAAALMTVSGVGVFLFVEFLRAQPAQGEIGPFRPAAAGVPVTPDRQWLEQEVLSARVAVENEPQNLELNAPQEFSALLDQYIQQIKQTNSAWDENDPKNREDVRKSLNLAVEKTYRTLEPEPAEKVYVFIGLREARDKGLPLTFRYRIDSGANSPDKTFKLTFTFDNYYQPPVETALGQYSSLSLPPTVIREDGTMVVRVFNGLLNAESRQARFNPEAISFPREGLLVSYSVGSYRVNFVRVMFALWVKLAFLAMAGVFAGSFLSFSVASLVSFAVFAMAESAPFLAKALVVFDEMDEKGRVVFWKLIVVTIAKSTSGLFKAYGDLQPTQRLVEGMLLSWSEVAVGLTFLTILTVILYFAAAAIFRKRELAIYSGQ